MKKTILYIFLAGTATLFGAAIDETFETALTRFNRAIQQQKPLLDIASEHERLRATCVNHGQLKQTLAQTAAEENANLLRMIAEQQPEALMKISSMFHARSMPAQAVRNKQWDTLRIEATRIEQTARLARLEKELVIQIAARDFAQVTQTMSEIHKIDRMKTYAMEKTEAFSAFVEASIKTQDNNYLTSLSIYLDRDGNHLPKVRKAVADRSVIAPTEKSDVRPVIAPKVDTLLAEPAVSIEQDAFLLALNEQTGESIQQYLQSLTDKAISQAMQCFLDSTHTDMKKRAIELLIAEQERRNELQEQERVPSDEEKDYPIGNSSNHDNQEYSNFASTTENNSAEKENPEGENIQNPENLEGNVIPIQITPPLTFWQSHRTTVLATGATLVGVSILAATVYAWKHFFFK